MNSRKVNELFEELKGWWGKSKINAIAGYLTILFVIAIIPLTVYLEWRDNYELDKYGRYTLGKIEKTVKSDGMYDNHFYYNVDGVDYKKVIVLKVKYDTTMFYYIKFSSRKPNISRVLYDIKVPIEIKKAPSIGWDSIPR